MSFINITTYDISQHDLKAIKKEIENKLIVGFNSVNDLFSSKFNILDHYNQKELFQILGIHFRRYFKNGNEYEDKVLSGYSLFKTSYMSSSFGFSSDANESVTISFDTNQNLERVELFCISNIDNIAILLTLDKNLRCISYIYMHKGIQVLKVKETFLSISEEIQLIKLKILCEKNKVVENMMPELHIDGVYDFNGNDFNERLKYCEVFGY